MLVTLVLRRVLAGLACHFACRHVFVVHISLRDTHYRKERSPSMAHCEKYPKAAVTGMFIHYERTAGHNLSNKDIDSSRSHLNYNVAETDQSLSQNLFLSQRLSEIKTNNRNNQNVICDWIVTQPKDVRSEDSHLFALGQTMLLRCLRSKWPRHRQNIQRMSGCTDLNW